MAITTDTASVYTDLNSLEQLKYKLKGDSVDDLRVVAQQFEAIFIQQMLKSMRDASLSEGLFDNDTSDFYVDMLDKQMSLEMSSGRGIGLADVIVQQLSGRMKLGSEDVQPQSLSPQPAPAEPAATPASQKNGDDSAIKVEIPRANKAPHSSALISSENTSHLTDPQTFIKSLWPLAVNAGQELGVAPQVLIAQAALETGWGQYIAGDGKGNSSHNLFNIKSGSSWQGNTVTLATTELKNGNPVKEYAAFRVYDSYNSSFDDYIALVKHNPRYRQALENAADPQKYMEALQQAGYATDPDYAAKILQIANGETMAHVSHSIQDASNS